jgi:hypothetical protein
MIGFRIRAGERRIFIIAAGTLQFARLDVTLALNGKIDL